MKRITGAEGQLVGIRLFQTELESRPDLFYQALDECRTVFYKTDIVPREGGVDIRSSHAWEPNRKALAER